MTEQRRLMFTIAVRHVMQRTVDTLLERRAMRRPLPWQDRRLAAIEQDGVAEVLEICATTSGGPADA